MPKYSASPRSLRPRDQAGQTRLCCVLGSGGHTTEMLKMVAPLIREGIYCPRIYIMADTDRFSEAKVVEIERTSSSGSHLIVRVPRAREVRSNRRDSD